MIDRSPMNRRDLLRSAASLAGAAVCSRPLLAASESAPIQAKAEHVISIWLGGGMAQTDTFDPKRRGDPQAKKAGSYYDSIETAVSGVRLCEHLRRVAPLMDRVTAVRTVHHDVIDEHAAATNRMHTGRPISGTISYPSIGSIIAHERGSASDEAPPYVLIGYPNVTRGPGFLGAQSGYLYLTDTSRGPAGLSRPPDVGTVRQERRARFRAAMRAAAPSTDDTKLKSYDTAIEQSLKFSGPAFNRVFQLDGEHADLRERYGGEFGQRCLLSRRLVEQGVRFVEVSHNLNFLNGTGWDTHNEGILKQHELIKELDSAVAALITDLEARRLLDKTLIVITTEFGRPPEFDGGGGRGHQGSSFTCVLAGGGLRHRGAWGETDDLAKKIVANPVGVPDFFATICAAVGVDYRANLHDGDRPVPITDQGTPIRELFS